MFTGLIESVGRIVDRAAMPGGWRLRVATALGPELRAGDSLAVNGVCLTVVAQNGDVVEAEISPETARVTTLGALAAGGLVNLERPLRADARLGGHFVQGHVDGVGRIEALRPEGEFVRLVVNYPSALAAQMVHRGSVAVDGISLTIAGLEGSRFDVQIVPYTLEHTNLQSAAVGDAVNLECDILGKYVARFLELRGIEGTSA